MRRILLVSLLFVPHGGLPAQHRFDPVAASAGGVWIRDGGDPWVSLGSSPLLAMASGLKAGIAHYPSPWGISALGGSAAVAATPLGPVSAGASLTRFGSALYSETALGLACGAAAGPVLLGGVIRYTVVSAERYGAAAVVSIDAAFVVLTGAWFRWGIRLTDVNRPAVGRSGERLRGTASAAASIRLPGAPQILVEAGRDEAGNFSAASGLVFAAGPVAARIGTTGAFDRIHCGIEVSGGPFGIGYGVVVHRELGWKHFLWLEAGWGS